MVVIIMVEARAPRSAPEAAAELNREAAFNMAVPVP
jgi:hypothetical protein